MFRPDPVEFQDRIQSQLPLQPSPTPDPTHKHPIPQPNLTYKPIDTSGRPAISLNRISIALRGKGFLNGLLR
jgi:hypothetical protein